MKRKERGNEGGKKQRCKESNTQCQRMSNQYFILKRYTLELASFPGPRPASHRLQYGKAVLQAMGSWARAWERG